VGDDGGTYRVLVVKPEGRRSLGIPRCRWEGNIKMYLMFVIPYILVIYVG
jgi:hypothetical protein